MRAVQPLHNHHQGKAAFLRNYACAGEHSGPCGCTPTPFTALWDRRMWDGLHVVMWACSFGDAHQPVASYHAGCHTPMLAFGDCWQAMMPAAAHQS